MVDEAAAKNKNIQNTINMDISPKMKDPDLFDVTYLRSWWKRPVTGQRSTVVIVGVLSDRTGSPRTR